jgi:hypothetical protein
VIALLRDELHYPYLDDWTDQPDYSNIEVGLLVRDREFKGRSLFIRLMQGSALGNLEELNCHLTAN